MKAKFYHLVVLSILSLALSACSSSPKSVGEDLGNEMIEAYQQNDQDTKECYEQFINELQANTFSSRADALARLAAIDQDMEQKRQAAIQDVENKVAAARDKYIGKYDELQQFNQAYDNTLSTYNEPSYKQSLLTTINNLISNISSPIPTEDEIKRQLHGRKISGAEGGYIGPDSYRTIDSLLIEKIDIRNTEINGEFATLETDLYLRGEEGGRFKCDVRLEFRIDPNTGEWVLKMLESRGVDVIRTGRYDSCISSEIEGNRGETALVISNHTDQSLLVGGTYKDQNDEWHKFCTIVKPNDKASIGCWFMVQVLDYTIDFVELP